MKGGDVKTIPRGGRTFQQSVKLRADQWFGQNCIHASRKAQSGFLSRLIGGQRHNRAARQTSFGLKPPDLAGGILTMHLGH